MIKTVIYSANLKTKSLSCHAVGLIGCLEIQEKHEGKVGGFDSYSYKAIYEDGSIVKIEDPIFVSDETLT